MIHIKSEKGFTLIEIILSILILAVISGVVIQLYIAAKDLSDKAKETDLAIITAGNAIELLKHYDDPFMVIEHEFFDLAITDHYSRDLFLSGGIISMGLYYDANFISCQEANAKYWMEITLDEATRDEMIIQSLTGDIVNQSELLDLQITITKLEGDLILVDHQLSHFYPYVR